MKIVLVGKGVGWDSAPLDGNVWGVNEIILRRQSFSKIFNIHKTTAPGCPDQAPQNRMLRKVCEKLGVDILDGDNFPLDEIIEEFGCDYFTTTVGYMIAYAIREKPQVIDMYGLNFATETEYQEQRGCVEFWTGVAIGRGIEVNIYGAHSQLLTCSGPYGKECLYGYNKLQEPRRHGRKQYADRNKEMTYEAKTNSVTERIKDTQGRKGRAGNYNQRA